MLQICGAQGVVVKTAKFACTVVFTPSTRPRRLTRVIGILQYLRQSRFLVLVAAPSHPSQLRSPRRYHVMYLNTNARALPAAEASKLFRQIAQNIKEACRITVSVLASSSCTCPVKTISLVHLWHAPNEICLLVSNVTLFSFSREVGGLFSVSPTLRYCRRCDNLRTVTEGAVTPYIYSI